MRKILLIFFMLGLAVQVTMLSGCALFSEAAPPPPPAPPPEPVAPPAPAPAPASGWTAPIQSFVAIRAILPSTTKPAEAAKGEVHAFIVLDERVSGRNREVCEAFKLLPTAQDVEEFTPDKLPIKTFWFAKAGRNVDPENCKSLLSVYDFAKAASARRVFGVPDTKGPVLIAVDASGDYFWIDMRKASDPKMLELLRGWAKIAAGGYEGDGSGKTIKSTNLFAKLGVAMCAAAPAAQKTALEKVNKINVRGVIGAVVAPFIAPLGDFVVGTTVSLLCPPEPVSAAV